MEWIIQELPKNKYPIKAEFEMKPIGITIHETDNNASAKNEIAYMQRNDNKVSFHFAVDETDIIQGLPLDRNAWHAGDGRSGTGNRKTIAIEICKNYKVDNLDNYYKARENAEKLVGHLMKVYGFDAKDIYTHNHWNGKNCPRIIRQEGYFDKFVANAAAYKDDAQPTPQPPSKKTNEEIAAEVKLGKWGNNPQRKKDLIAAGYDYDAIQAIVNGKPQPPKQENKPVRKTNEQIADEVKAGKWGNNPKRKNDLIKAGYDYDAIQAIVNGQSPSKPKPSKIEKGSKVQIVSSATKYATGQNIPSRYKGVTYTVSQLGNDRALLKEIMSWVFLKDLKAV